MRQFGIMSFGEQYLARLNKTKLTVDDILMVEKYCYELVREENLYDLQNDAKLRAVISTKSYDEFKSIVDAAHLRPIDKADKQRTKTQNRIWNTAASN